MINIMINKKNQLFLLTRLLSSNLWIFLSGYVYVEKDYGYFGIFLLRVKYFYTNLDESLGQVLLL
jgi:hypothetical protein